MNRLAMASWAAMAPLCLASVGCATTRPAPRDLQPLAAGQILLHMQGGTEQDRDQVAHALEEAIIRMTRWGGLRRPVTVRVYADHRTLEDAAGLHQAPWLRGWSRYSDMELEAPSSWGAQWAPHAVLELVVHELTHSVMYQRAGTERSWRRLDIPLWFREGMASVTSNQGYRRMTLAQMAAYLREHPAADLWSTRPFPPEEQPIMYGAAHRAFESLLATVGDEGVLRILDLVAGGRSFALAFEDVVQRTPRDFLQHFIQTEVLNPPGGAWHLDGHQSPMVALSP